MVTSKIETRNFAIKVSAIIDGFPHMISSQNELTFMQVSDYAEHSLNFYRFDINAHPEWEAVQIEVGVQDFGTVQLIEIARN